MLGCSSFVAYALFLFLILWVDAMYYTHCNDKYVLFFFFFEQTNIYYIEINDKYVDDG